MIIAPVRSQVAFSDGRLDAKYHCSPGVLANERMQTLALAGAELRPVAGDAGLGQVGSTPGLVACTQPRAKSRYHT